MQILFIFSLVFAILVSLFAVMNSNPVTIKLLWKQFQFSQAIVILGSAAFGAIIVALLGVFSRVKSRLKIRELQNKIKNLEKQIEESTTKQDLDMNINDNIDIENELKNVDGDNVSEEINLENSDKEERI